MSSNAFRKWAERFDAQHRYGIPVLPIRKADPVSPSIVELPARSGSLKFSAEDVSATIELLGKATPGQAVRLTDAADAKENTSRRRAEIMKQQIEESTGGEPIKPGFKLRGHVLTAGTPEVRKVSGKNYNFYPENWGAVSLVPDSDPENSADDTPPADDTPADDTPPAPDDTEATEGKGKGKGK